MGLPGWLWRRFQPLEGRAVFLAVLTASLSAALGLTAAQWMPGSGLFWHVALAGLLLGRALARSRLRRGWGAFFLAAAGLAYVGGWLVRLSLPLWAAAQAAWRSEWPLSLAWLNEAAARVASLGQALVAWMGSWLGLNQSPGVLAALFAMAFLLWASAAFAGWTLLRGRRPLIPFLPLGALLAASVFLGQAGLEYLIVFTACVVVSSPLLVLNRQEREWTARRVPYSEEFRFDAGQVAVLSVILFVAVAVLLPSIRVRAVVDWFAQQFQGPQEVAGEVLERTFPGARAASWNEWHAAEAELPTERLLSGSPELERTLVMFVSLDTPAPQADVPPSEAGPAGRAVYSRGGVYREYVGAGWKVGPAEASAWPAYAPLTAAVQPGRRLLRQTFLLLVRHGKTLYAAGEPYSVDQLVTVRRLPDAGDVVALEGALDRYTVLSLVPQVTAEELDAAQAVYPSAIVEAYLALPANLPPRVVDLAREVTAQAATPLEAAAAIEAFLRSYPYDLQVPLPPEGRDVVDYFLFDLQRGYCDYFASAMVVLARAVGIPARLAVGYATGSYSLARSAYVVTERDAHSWPELYFAGYGWIPFEPTPGREGPGLVQGDLPRPEAVSRPGRALRTALQVHLELFWLHARWWLPGGAAVLLLACLTWKARRRWPLRLDGPGRVALRFLQLRDSAGHLGVPQQQADTAAEFAAALALALRQRTPRLPWLAGLVEPDVHRALDELALLTATYERISYAPTLPGADLLRSAWRGGRRLRARLRRLWALSSA